MVALALAVMLQAVAPVEATASSAGREIANPDWRRVERGGSPLRFYPAAAQRRGIEGSATIACVVDAGGMLHDCQVLSEAPAGVGFGEAAVRMSVLFRMRPLDKDGQKVDGGVVRIPIRFRLPRR